MNLKARLVIYLLRVFDMFGEFNGTPDWQNRYQKTTAGTEDVETFDRCVEPVGTTLPRF